MNRTGLVRRNPAGPLGDPTAPVWEEHPVLVVVETASIAAAAYHGYRRNQSVGWAVWWGFMGALFPFVTIPVAIAQGFGEPEK